MKLVGILDPRKQHPHDNDRERQRRLRQIAAGQLREENGLHRTWQFITSGKEAA